jgi:hypothetical protein
MSARVELQAGWLVRYAIHEKRDLDRERSSPDAREGGKDGVETSSPVIVKINPDTPFWFRRSD